LRLNGLVPIFRQKETMKRVLFACVQNSGRSQMAAAFFNSFCAPALVRGISAGPRAGDRVQPEVLEAMKEIGFDLRNPRPQLLTPELAKSADLLVTFACDELCPVVPGQRRMDWSLRAPEEQPIDEVRRIRDELRGRIWRLVAKEGWYKLQPVSVLRSWALQPGT
jgi:arsenate reductase